MLVIGFGWLTLLGSGQQVAAAPARFWLSTSNTSPVGPEAPTVQSGLGSIHQIYIWGQPQTVFSGPYHSFSNPFKRLQNISLNLVSTNALVDFLDGSYIVYNPPGRFEYVHDSTSVPPLTSDRTAAGCAVRHR